MATNTLLTIDMITKRALASLHSKVLFPGLVVREYDKSFAQTGAKIGDTLRVRKPARYTTNTVEDLTSLVANTTEEYVTLPVTNLRNVAMSFGSAERTLSLDDYQKNIIDPAMAQIAADMEVDCINNTINGIGNLVIATGSSATVLTATDILAGGAKISAGTGPLDMRYFMANPFDQASLINELKGLFQDASQVSAQYRDASFGRTFGYDWKMSNALPNITIGADVAGAVNGVTAAGATTIIVDGFTGSQVIAAGTVFTIAGVNAVQPETKADLGYLYQFTAVQAVTLSGGAGTITISSASKGGAPIYATGARQNVTALPADDAVITLAGAANTTYRQNIGFQKNAFAVASVDLDAFWAGATSSRQVMDGLSMRVALGSDVLASQNICRADILFGTSVLRPEYACRYWTKIS